MIRGIEKMKNKTLTVAFVVLLVLSCLNVFTVNAFASKPEFRRVIIGFKERPSNSLIEGLGGTIKYTYNAIPAIACSLPVQAIEALRNNPQIEYIDEDVIISVTGKPDKPDNPKKPPKSPKVGYIEVRSFVDSSEVPLPYKVNAVRTGDTPDTIERVPATYAVTISYGDETEEQLIEVSSRKTSLAYFQFTEIPPPPPLVARERVPKK